MGDPVIELRGVRKRYGETVAVRDLDLDIPRGSTFALLGPNGSGKTTTIRMILRIQEPDAGVVRLFGGPVRPRALEKIGYLPEERGLYERMTVRGVLSFLAELKGIGPRESRDRIVRWLERVELADRADDRVEGLSKGMQQKLQFVAAMVHEPEVVILDEPFGGLDPINQQGLRDILDDLRARNRTIVFSTHIIEHAEKLCDHVCILSRGDAVARGPVREVKREHGELYVDLAIDPWTPEAVTTVRREPGVARVTRDGHRLEIALADGADPRTLLSSLVELGIPLRRFEVVEPSLRQVFLERVGSPPDEMKASIPGSGA